MFAVFVFFFILNYEHTTKREKTRELTLLPDLISRKVSAAFDSQTSVSTLDISHVRSSAFNQIELKLC